MFVGFCVVYIDIVGVCGCDGCFDEVVVFDAAIILVIGFVFWVMIGSRGLNVLRIVMVDLMMVVRLGLAASSRVVNFLVMVFMKGLMFVRASAMMLLIVLSVGRLFWRMLISSRMMGRSVLFILVVVFLIFV